jgi:hypothetical protein
VQNDIEQRPDSLTSGSDHLGQGLRTHFGATVSGRRSLAKGASNRSLFLALCHCGSSFRFNISLHRRACPEAYLVTIFVLQRVLDADLSIPIIGAFYCNLCFFRFVRMWRLNNRFDDSWQGGMQPRLSKKAHSVDQQLRIGAQSRSRRCAEIGRARRFHSEAILYDPSGPRNPFSKTARCTYNCAIVTSQSEGIVWLNHRCKTDREGGEPWYQELY